MLHVSPLPLSPKIHTPCLQSPPQSLQVPLVSHHACLWTQCRRVPSGIAVRPPRSGLREKKV